jgi:hypothetical protein
VGIEPTTYGLRVQCSSLIELQALYKSAQITTVTIMEPIKAIAACSVKTHPKAGPSQAATVTIVLLAFVLIDIPSCFGLVGPLGIEPRTCGLKARCSA